jgi:hypothetical protein
MVASGTVTSATKVRLLVHARVGVGTTRVGIIAGTGWEGISSGDAGVVTDDANVGIKPAVGGTNRVGVDGEVHAALIRRIAKRGNILKFWGLKCGLPLIKRCILNRLFNKRSYLLRLPNP